jgi:hypothetical protein
MNRRLLALVAAAALIALCGLVLLHTNDAQLQSYSTAAKAQLPSMDSVHFVSDVERKVILHECMTAAGFSTYVADPIENQTLTQSERESAIKYQIADSVCAAKNPPDPSKYGLMGKEQRGNLYDYYVRWLVPCLESSGHQLSDAPTRKAFVGASLTPGRWNPYDSISNVPLETLVQLQGKCLPWPPGLH